MAHQDLHWDSLKVTSTRDKEKTVFLLLKVLDEAGLLTQPIRSLEARKNLVNEINRSISRMPKSIRQAFMNDGNACVSSLTQLAISSKRNHNRKLGYYEKTASHMLRNEYFYIVDLEGKFKGPFLLSNILRDHRGFYSDGTIEERLLDYNIFLEYLYENHFDADNHEIRLLFAETSSDGVFEGIETNKVYNYASWISAMIEEQNVLQDIPKPFEFHIVDPEARECAYECDWTTHADSMVSF